uniref:Putative secreted protein n=1 Tax=Panstrongylus lignarius TaxID=156445 RepID=A0A224Y4G6_9HEMI
MSGVLGPCLGDGQFTFSVALALVFVTTFSKLLLPATQIVGDFCDVSFKLVLGCFCIVNSWPSNVFKYWICCGDGTGIKFGSLPG